MDDEEAEQEALFDADLGELTHSEYTAASFPPLFLTRRSLFRESMPRAVPEGTSPRSFCHSMGRTRGCTSPALPRPQVPMLCSGPR